MPISPSNALASMRRSTFTGTNDKYRPVLRNTNLKNSLADYGFFDIAPEELFTTTYKESSQKRMSAYKHFYDFYNGNHWLNEWDNGERKPVNNFCKVIVDRAVDFFLARGFQISSVEGNEAVAEALDMIWEKNYKSLMTTKLLKSAGITGDAYCYVSVESKDKKGKDLPRDQWTVKLTSLEPQYVYPVWDDTRIGAMSACLIQFPLNTSTNGSQTIFSMLITPEYIKTFNDAEEQTTMENPFGEVNVVHITNDVEPGTNFGNSDIEHIIPLNEQYNTTLNSIRRIISYHAEPTTIIYGAKASRLEKGANRVWSNLPKPQDAKVENLALDSDLNAVYKYLEGIESMIYRMSKTPRQAFELSQGISNTSGIALELTFQPLLDKVRRKQQGFTVAVKKINKLIMFAHREILGEPLEALAVNQERALETGVKYTSPLPRDEQAEIDSATKKLAVGITSKAEEIRKVNRGVNTERISLEILADEMQALMLKWEQAKAISKGLIAPQPESVFTGSVGMNEDFVTLQQSIAALNEEESQEESL